MLEQRGYQVLTLQRDGLPGETLNLSAADGMDSWSHALHGIDQVIHLAGLAHRHPDPAQLEETNTRWPLRLFRAAGRASLDSFVWLSSIKVLGEVSERPLKETDPYAEGDPSVPLDPYASSKIQAERALRQAQAEFPGTRLAIVRPPLVYGPGVKANFLSLLRWAERCGRGLPLPLGAARAPRSLIGVANLCEVIVASLARRGVFHCADDEDLSVAELLVKVGARPDRLWAVPDGLIRNLSCALGWQGTYQRVFQPLQVEQTQSRQVLGWTPVRSTDEQLMETLAWFQRHR